MKFKINDIIWCPTLNGYLLVRKIRKDPYLVKTYYVLQPLYVVIEGAYFPHIYENTERERQLILISRSSKK